MANKHLANENELFQRDLCHRQSSLFSLRNKTPFIQVIDAPILPIAPVQLSLVRQIFIGLIIGGALGIAIIIGRKIFKGAMSLDHINAD